MHLTQNPIIRKYRLVIVPTLFVAIGSLAICSGCKSEEASNPLSLQAEDYKVARSHFKTQLTRRGAAPQDGETLHAPGDAIQVDYSVDPPLEAWLSLAPKQDKKPPVKHPAILFLHGGFAIGSEDWDMTKPYRTAGFIVMAPVLRGENGQAGNYSMFYDEVKDVLSAQNYLAKLPNVDPKRIYVAGHSVGGTLALLSAMTTNKFRGAASFSGSPDQIAWSKQQPEVIPFDPKQIREFQMRSPLAFATSFKCPVRLYYGSEEAWAEASSQRTAALAKEEGLNVAAVSVPGNHFSSVPFAIQRSIKFFEGKNPSY